MIRYQLKCGQDHEFEAWFLNGATYDSQQASGDVACPFCGATEVIKAPMAPNLSTGRAESREIPEPGECGEAAEERAEERVEERVEERARDVAEKILHAVDMLRDHVAENCDYVGDDFADEARRIHDGETDERDIYGEASDEEAEELDDEGVPYFRLPFPRRRDS